MVRNKLHICKDWHIQPSEIDRLPYYEYELICQEINIINKEQEKEDKKQQKQYDSMQKSMNPSSYMNQMKHSMPSMNNISMPKVNMPKF